MTPVNHKYGCSISQIRDEFNKNSISIEKILIPSLLEIIHTLFHWNLQGIKWIDFGCWTWNLSNTLHVDRGIEMTGIDSSDAQLERAKSKYKNIVFYKHLLDIEDNSADFCVLKFSHSSLDEAESDRVIDTIYRKLKKWWHIIFADENWDICVWKKSICEEYPNIKKPRNLDKLNVLLKVSKEKSFYVDAYYRDFDHIQNSLKKHWFEKISLIEPDFVWIPDWESLDEIHHSMYKVVHASKK